MARTKSTARKTGQDPRAIPQKLYKGQAKAIPLQPLKHVLQRRKFSQGVRTLREIRKAMKALALAIPRLPFHRLCRDICDIFKISARW